MELKKISIFPDENMSCLFDSVAHFTENCSSQQLRRMVIDYLRSNPRFWDTMEFKDVFQMFAPEDVHDARSTSDYIARMSRDSTWGGAIEIQAMCNMFRISIRIHVLGDNGTIEFLPAAAGIRPEHVIELTWNGSHFEPHG